ncbi:YdcF family protein [Microvirga sp. ACRRW]|uniref:YdcF family protein n=1 Tax=Microvirga sp. ACRRW TaxID=2918205 RepID=UPI001EF606BB|nr:YdcF family protein [Microvirga sp. ACRRW]MCG7394753.1 YdcF family protein [Microvirga sp. ACRRW]
MAVTFTLTTLALGILPIANYVLFPLEQRFPVFVDDGKSVEGIILLGGSVESADSGERGVLVSNEASERVLYAIELAYRYPNARILISGGGGTVFSNGTAEAPIIADYLKRVGVDPSRIVIEDRSRTTSENGQFSRDLLKPREGERWLLITSAWHMPRAMAVFEKAGLPVIAYPVDFRTNVGFANQRPRAFVSEGLRRLDVSMKEWVGVIGYYATGRTDELLPSPHD